MKARHFVCMAALMMPATSVLASDFSYTYVGVGFNATQQDNIVDPSTTNTTREDASGLDFNASWQFHNNLFAVYDYRNHDFDEDTLDFQRTSLGLGWRTNAGDATDLVAVLRAVGNSYDDVNGDTQFDVTGGASVGLRHGVTDLLTLGFHVDYVYEGAFEDDTSEVFVDYSALRADTSLRYEGVYTLMNNFGGITGSDSIDLTFGGSLNDDFRTVNIGLRYSI